MYYKYITHKYITYKYIEKKINCKTYNDLCYYYAKSRIRLL